MMRITINRSGGFANIPLHREIDTSTLADGPEIERLATTARHEPASKSPMPDAYVYDITIDGLRYVMTEPTGAWGTLIERLTR
jgi:hypothetical protein